jgi:dTDP-glucose 4,6-dehydratase
MPQSADALFADCERSVSKSDTARLERLRNGTLLITGGTGFVGLWLSVFAAFLNDKYNFGVEIISTARRPGRLADQAGFLQSRSDFRFVASDIRQFMDFPTGTNWMIHAAGVPDSRHHASNPIETMVVIAHGTDRVLRFTEQAVNLNAILHVSSSLVNGEQPSSVPALTEDFHGALAPPSVSNCYTEAKRYSETLCAAYRSQLRLPIIITRPFTFLGPFQSLDAPWAANNFLYAAVEGQPLKILGGGESLRTYLYGSDMALLMLQQLVRGQIGSIYNLGHTEVISLRDLAELVVRQSGRGLDIRYNTAGRDVAVSRLIPDMSKSIKEFSFAPAFTVSDAVSQTFKWYGAGHHKKRSAV